MTRRWVPAAAALAFAVAALCCFLAVQAVLRGAR